MKTETVAIVHGDGVFSAVEHLLQSEAASGEVAECFYESMKELYWMHKQVGMALRLGHCGVMYALTMAQKQDEAAAEPLRGVAKRLAYDMASFAWPGWAEPGISLDDADIAIGYDAAKLNLRLAIQLNRSAKAMANAHWMIGAYAIVDRRTADATVAFEQAAALAEESRDPAAKRMNIAYAALAQLAANPAADANRCAAFEEGMRDLLSEGSDEASFYAKQLKTARGVFCLKSES